MPDRQLTPLTPLGRRDPLVEPIGGLKISEVTTTAIASVASRRGRMADVERAAAGISLVLPGPGRMSQGDPWSAIWSGPGQWLVTAPFAGHEDIVADLEPVFAGAASITEQSDAFARFDLTGIGPASLIERLCPLDVRSMKAGDAGRSVVEHVGCHLLCLAPDHFAVLAPRSFAGSLRHALAQAARSVAAIAALA